MTLDNREYLSSAASRLSPKTSTQSVPELKEFPGKIDFLKSLNLFLNKSEDPMSSLKLPSKYKHSDIKKCRVLLNILRCEVCSRSLSNQADLEMHKKLHDPSNDKSGATRELSSDEEKKTIASDNCSEFDSDELEKLKSCRKRRKNRFIKLTLKIGDEIITKTLCKKKYLNKIKEATNQVHIHETCSEIKNSLHKCNMESKDVQGNENRLRKMAEALVELELLRNGGSHCSSDEESDNSVTLEFHNDAQEIFSKATKECEVITITDDFEDDCVIVHERLLRREENSLNNSKNTFSVHISREHDANGNVVTATNNNRMFGSKGIASWQPNDEFKLKKQKLNDSQSNFQFSSQLPDEKENRTFEGPRIKLSQLAIPLRLINL